MNAEICDMGDVAICSGAYNHFPPQCSQAQPLTHDVFGTLAHSSSL